MIFLQIMQTIVNFDCQQIYKFLSYVCSLKKVNNVEKMRIIQFFSSFIHATQVYIGIYVYMCIYRSFVGWMRIRRDKMHINAHSAVLRASCT